MFFSLCCCSLSWFVWKNSACILLQFFGVLDPHSPLPYQWKGFRCFVLRALRYIRLDKRENSASSFSLSAEKSVARSSASHRCSRHGAIPVSRNSSFYIPVARDAKTLSC
ncbi:hypothetical protein M440DRAFT_1399398 [Trichoderma longibrachiatum ATCC 18648]|uniref:Secreted protein n=1 Tax=Trichoderma longibrachiatum ATCC 18648 TaxID=983965 RepID=A0A2T4C9H3_TRILO|nr:hypothetical protein M440DRAFT_1399398 [Trichoderma longibrachiatum ATCC 18648]